MVSHQSEITKGLSVRSALSQVPFTLTLTHTCTSPRSGSTSSFNMFPAPHKLWGGNNTCTYVHIFIHLLTCQRGLAKLTHFSPQSGADSGEGQHVITGQTLPCKVAAVCRHMRDSQQHFFTRDLCRLHGNTLSD